MYILFLEDNENRIKVAKQLFIGHSVTWCRTVAEAIVAMSKIGYDLYSLDHDLGGGQMLPSDEKSGFAVVEHMAEMDRAYLPRYVIIHSFNPVGSEKMQNFIWDMNAVNNTEVTPIRVLFGSKEYEHLLNGIFEHVPNEKDY